MSKVHFGAALVALAAVAIIATLLFSGERASAADPEPTVEDTARLLGYLWGDGSESNGVWSINGPSGTSSLIEELVEMHGGTWVDRSKLAFRLSAPYNWSDWKSSLPNDTWRERAAVNDPNFLAALLETEGAVDGHVYDQSACCVDGFTFERLTDLHDLLLRSGYDSAQLVRFNNVESGKITIAPSDFTRLRSNTTYVCPNRDSNIRIPGGTDYASYGNLQWIDAGDRWGDVVRTDCRPGQTVPNPTTLDGSCVATANGNTVTLDWTFTLGNVVVRRDGSFITAVPGRDGAWTETRPNGSDRYDLRVFAFGVRTDVSCGTVTLPGDGTPPPPPPADGPCSAVAAGNQVLLSWDDFGKNKYFVRKNGSWAKTVTGATSTSITGSLQDSWSIRYFNGGVRTDIPCTSDAPAGPCQVTSAAGGARITWDAIDGVSKYQVRRNNKWRATVTNTTVFTDTTGSTADSYVIRYWMDGSRNDISCG